MLQPSVGLGDSAEYPALPLFRRSWRYRLAVDEQHSSVSASRSDSAPWRKTVADESHRVLTELRGSICYPRVTPSGEPEDIRCKTDNSYTNDCRRPGRRSRIHYRTESKSQYQKIRNPSQSISERIVCVRPPVNRSGRGHHSTRRELLARASLHPLCRSVLFFWLC